MKIEDRLTIAAPVEQVWALTEHIEGWPTLTPTITSVERLDDGELGEGSRARLVQPGQRPRVWTVTRFEPPHLFVWRAQMGPVIMIGSHVLEPVDSGVVNVLGLELEGRWSRPFGVLARRSLAKSIHTENLGFQRAAEDAHRRVDPAG